MFVFVCFLFKISVFKILLQRTIRVATRFDPDQTRQNVGSNLSLIYLQIFKNYQQTTKVVQAD